MGMSFFECNSHLIQSWGLLVRAYHENLPNSTENSAAIRQKNRHRQHDKTKTNARTHDSTHISVLCGGIGNLTKVVVLLDEFPLNQKQIHQTGLNHGVQDLKKKVVKKHTSVSLLFEGGRFPRRFQRKATGNQNPYFATHPYQDVPLVFSFKATKIGTLKTLIPVYIYIYVVSPCLQRKPNKHHGFPTLTSLMSAKGLKEASVTPTS